MKMNLWILLALVSTSVLFADGGAAAEPFGRPGPYPVGVRTIVLTDASREDPLTESHRTLVVEVWYPSTDEAENFPKTRFGDFFSPYLEQAERVLGKKLAEIETRFQTIARRNAPLRSVGKGEELHPLLIFSHGNGGFRHQNCFQMDHLASHGYVVASPDHTGNSRLSPLPDRAVLYDRKGRERSSKNRPRDVSFLIDWFTARNNDASSWLQGRIDSKRIGVFGHSFGGYAACRAAAEDRRIRAIIPMTVAVSGLGIPPADIPTMVMVGRHDRTIRTAGNLVSKAYYVGCPAEKILLELKRGGHFTFCDMAVLDPDFGDGIGRGKGLDGKIMDFIPVPLAKELINAYTLAFFESHLRKRAAAAKFLTSNGYPEELDHRHEGPRSASEDPKKARAQNEPEAARQPIKVLIVTGEDVPAHDWKATTPVTRKILESADGEFDVRVSEDIGILESDAIHLYDALVLSFRNNPVKRDLNLNGRRNLQDYIKSGKGVVTLHFNICAFRNWEEYRQVLGRYWKPKHSKHGERGPCEVKVTDVDHPITRDLGNFTIDDELYANLIEARPNRVLLEAYSDWSKKVEPVAWTVDYGKGRVFNFVLGHDVKARRNPYFGEVLRRGVRWAAGPAK